MDYNTREETNQIVRAEDLSPELVSRKTEIDKKADRLEEDVHLSEDEFNESLNALAQKLLFHTRFQEKAIYDSKIVKKLPTLVELPLLCKGRECPYAPVCPVIAGLTDAQIAPLLDKPCRDEREFSVRLFGELVNELGIGPDNTIDKLAIASLVRLYMLKRRSDRRIQIEDIIVEEPVAVDQRSGTVVYKNAIHPLLVYSDKFEAQIERVLKQLMASRKDRLQAAMSVKGAGSFMEVLLDRVEQEYINSQPQRETTRILELTSAKPEYEEEDEE